MRAQREHHVHFAAHAFDQAADLRQVRRHVEGAILRPDDVDERLFALFPHLGRRHLLRAEFLPQPGQRAVGGLPLILIDGARQEANDAGAFRRHAAADHFGDGAGDDDRRQRRIERAPGALHGALGAGLGQLIFAQAGNNDGQFVRRQAVSIVQHRSDRQVFAAHRAIDDNLQALHRGEAVHGAPIAAGPIMIEHEHGVSPRSLRSPWRRRSSYQRISS